MTSTNQSGNLHEVSKECLDQPLVQAAQVAITYLERSLQRKSSRPMQVFQELAVRTLQRGREGRSVEFSAENLKQGVAKDAVKDPSAWISELWKKLLADEPTWQEGLRDVAKQLKLSYIPKLVKRPGSPAYYFLAPVELEEAEKKEVVTALPVGGVHYTPEVVVAPASWLGTALRSGVIPWSFGVRWGVAAVVMGAFLLVLLAWLSVILTGLNPARVLRYSDLVSIFVLGAAGYLVYHLFMFFDALFDQRIVMAPAFLTPLKQDNVTLEFRQVEGDDTRIELAFVRYSAICPLCGGSISIHDGLSAFPDRLIGRCRRSAREHIYSFDPVLKIGRPLR